MLHVYVILWMLFCYGHGYNDGKILERILALEKRVTEQEGKLEEKDSTIQHLLEQNQKLGSRVDSLETFHKKVSALFQNLNSNFSSLSSSNRQLSEKLLGLIAKVDALENSYQTLSTTAETFRPKSSLSKPAMIGMARHENGSASMIFEASGSAHMTNFTEVKYTVTNDSAARQKQPAENKTNRFQRQYLSEKDNRPRQSGQPEIVAFHAVSDKGLIDHIGVNQNIVFETVFLNLGNGYHNQHGVFIAPTTGVYIFSASVLSSNNYKMFDVVMLKNGFVLAKLYGYGASPHFDQGSATIITQLSASDEIWLQLECCADDSLHGERYTTFAGALLFST